MTKEFIVYLALLFFFFFFFAVLYNLFFWGREGLKILLFFGLKLLFYYYYYYCYCCCYYYYYYYYLWWPFLYCSRSVPPRQQRYGQGEKAKQLWPVICSPSRICRRDLRGVGTAGRCFPSFLSS